MNQYESEITQPSEDYWRGRARSLVLRLNFNWWLSWFLPGVIIISIVSAVLLLWMRQQGMEAGMLWIGYLSGMLIIAGFAWTFARSNFVSLEDALVRLEYVHGLENRLTSASAGVGEWPAPGQGQNADDDFYRTRYHEVGGPLGISCILLLAAAFVPVTTSTQASDTPSQQPHAWQQVDQWVEALKEEDIVQPERLEDIEEALDKLRAQPPEDWYEHGSLEAGETLHSQTESALRELGSNLESAREMLDAMEKGEEALTSMQMEALSKELQELAKQMELGKLPLNKELLQKLLDIDPKSLKTLSSKELEELKKRLKETSEKCQACADGKPGAGKGGKSGLSKEAEEALMAMPVQVPGGADISRGPGAAPLTLNANESDLGTNNREAVSNTDLERATIGDTVGISADEHDVEKEEYQGPNTGGEAKRGSGGEAVWRSNLTPRESEIVERYFE